MQQTFLNILKKYFNVIKALADFFFCLVVYNWPKSIKDDFFFLLFFFFLSKENAVGYFIIIIIGK